MDEILKRDFDGLGTRLNTVDNNLNAFIVGQNKDNEYMKVCAEENKRDINVLFIKFEQLNNLFYKFLGATAVIVFILQSLSVIATALIVKKMLG